jgi:hypothetical protein
LIRFLHRRTDEPLVHIFGILQSAKEQAPDDADQYGESESGDRIDVVRQPIEVAEFSAMRVADVRHQGRKCGVVVKVEQRRAGVNIINIFSSSLLLLAKCDNVTNMNLVTPKAGANLLFNKPEAVLLVVCDSPMNEL